MPAIGEPVATPFWRQPGLGGWIAALLVVVAVAISLKQTIGKTEEFQYSDFGAYYDAGRLVSQGDSPYAMRGRTDACFVYAPAAAYLFVPLQAFDYVGASRVWTIVNWAACGACVWLAWTLTVGPDRRRSIAWAAVGMAAIPILNYFLKNVRSGQVGAIMAALCLAWAVCRRRGWSFSGGLCLAAACALKITPALLLPYLAIRRDWRGLAGAAVGGVALILMPAVSGDVSNVVAWHRDWVNQTLSTQSVAQTVRPANQSLLGELARLPWISDGETWADLEFLAIVQRVYPFVVIAVTAGVYSLINRTIRMGPATDDPAENQYLTVLLVMITLVNPRAWPCNFVVLILPCATMARIVWQKAPGWRVATAVLVTILLVGALPAMHSAGAAGSWWVWLKQGRHFWTAIATTAVCGWLQRRSVSTAIVVPATAGPELRMAA
jgi:hypothetical protein